MMPQALCITVPHQQNPTMKTLTMLSAALLASGPLAAQQVLCAGGDEHVNADRSISFTLGEPVNTTVTGPAATLTQGFEQPWALITTGVADRSAGNINVYPNPTRHVLYVDHGAFVDGERYELLNGTGAIVLEGAITGPMTALDMERFASGGYVLRLHADDAKLLRTFKITVTR
jgi:hypothetical protein